MNITKRLFLAILFLGFLSTSAISQERQIPEYFDLIIFGSNLNAETISVSLKKNPGIKNNWQKLEDEIEEKGDENNGILIFRNLSTNTFAGQDIRENYIAMKLSSSENAEMKAIYALPHTDLKSSELGSKLHFAIQHQPKNLQQFSIASQVRPRPISIAGKGLIEHIEMPVRHIKPGVNEVRWLDILFSRN